MKRTIEEIGTYTTNERESKRVCLDLTQEDPEAPLTFADDLPREIQLEIVLGHCDAATQLSFFQTCHQNLGLYERHKQPGADVSLAIAENNYLDLFRWWFTASDLLSPGCPECYQCNTVATLNRAGPCPYQKRHRIMVRLVEALVHGHTALAAEMKKLRHILTYHGLPNASQAQHLEPLLRAMAERDIGNFGKKKAAYVGDRYPNLIRGYLADVVKLVRSDARTWRLVTVAGASSPKGAHSGGGDTPGDTLHAAAEGLYNTVTWAETVAGLILRDDAEHLLPALNMAGRLDEEGPLIDPAPPSFLDVVKFALALGRAHLLPFIFREEDLYPLLLQNGFLRTALVPYLLYDASCTSSKWINRRFGSFAVPLLTHKVSDDDFWILTLVSGGRYPKCTTLNPRPTLIPNRAEETSRSLANRISRAQLATVLPMAPYHKEIDALIACPDEKMTFTILCTIVGSDACSRAQAAALARLASSALVAEAHARFLDWSKNEMAQARETPGLMRALLGRPDAPETGLGVVLDVVFHKLRKATRNHLPLPRPHILMRRMKGAWKREHFILAVGECCEKNKHRLAGIEPTDLLANALEYFSQCLSD